jgi:hydrogenase maturation factor
MVHAGYAIQKLNEEETKEAITSMKTMISNKDW